MRKLSQKELLSEGVGDLIKGTLKGLGRGIRDATIGTAKLISPTGTKLLQQAADKAGTAIANIALEDPNTILREMLKSADGKRTIQKGAIGAEKKLNGGYRQIELSGEWISDPTQPPTPFKTDVFMVRGADGMWQFAGGFDASGNFVFGKQQKINGRSLPYNYRGAPTPNQAPPAPTPNQAPPAPTPNQAPPRPNNPRSPRPNNPRSPRPNNPQPPAPANPPAPTNPPPPAPTNPPPPAPTNPPPPAPTNPPPPAASPAPTNPPPPAASPSETSATDIEVGTKVKWQTANGDIREGEIVENKPDTQINPETHVSIKAGDRTHIVRKANVIKEGTSHYNLIMSTRFESIFRF